MAPCKSRTFSAEWTNNFYARSPTTFNPPKAYKCTYRIAAPSNSAIKVKFLKIGLFYFTLIYIFILCYVGCFQKVSQYLNYLKAFKLFKSLLTY